MDLFVAFLNRVVREEEGQDVVEYALVVGLLSIVAVVAMATAGDSIAALWDRLAAEIDGVTPTL